MTLTELVVGMSLLSIVSGLSVAFFVGIMQQSSNISHQDLNAASARTALDQITGLLRVADSPTSQPGYATGRFTTISSTSVVFYSNVSPNRQSTAARTAPAKVQISVVSGQLVEYLWWPLSATPPSDYTTNYATNPSTTTVLLTSITNSDVFTYYATPADASTAPLQTTSPTSVASVTVKLAIGALRGENVQSVQSTVAITGALS
jgi:Tfp pilus assembly protein FimT